MSASWPQLGLVMLGGALGAAARFLLGGWILRLAAGGFPWGTLVVNLLGCLLAGFLMVWLESRGQSAALWRALLLVGLAGGFTTFSALMLELHVLQRVSGFGAASAYLAVSLVGGIALFQLGLRLAEGWRP